MAYCLSVCLSVGEWLHVFNLTLIHHTQSVPASILTLGAKHTQTRTHTHTHTHTHIAMHSHTQTGTHNQMHVSTHTYANKDTHTLDSCGQSTVIIDSYSYSSHKQYNVCTDVCFTILQANPPLPAFLHYSP